MRLISVLTFLLLPAGLLAAPASDPIEYSSLDTRQARPAKPPPCVRNPATSANETKARFDKFAQAFIYKKNITEAFSYIAQDYIVLLPLSLPQQKWMRYKVKVE